MAASAPDFAKMVPGFDFLQGLVKNASSVLPNIGQWVAPTLDPEELSKRIEELRTVQFWLEQNARMLGATIQALEVQRMTLSTLKTMNVQVADLRDAMKIRMPEVEAPAEPAPAPAAPAPAAAKPRPAASRAKAAEPAPALPGGVVDPMQWWGALTKQFGTLATQAMKDAASDSAKNLAGSLVKQSIHAAENTLKAGIDVGMAPARKAAEVAGNVRTNVARSAAEAKRQRTGKGAAAPAAKKRRAAGRDD
jgi:hypothetical protein